MLDANIVAAASIALSVTLVAIFSLRPLAPRLGLVDRPNERKRHRGRVPLIGGLCFFLGLVAGLGYLGGADRFVVSLLAMGAVIMLAGLLDDMYELGVGPRLAVQGGAAMVMIATTGVHIDTLGQLFGDWELRLGVLGIPLTVIAVVGLINAFNMTDGIDGLAGGLSLVSIVSMLALGMGAGWQAFGVLVMLQVLMVALVPYLSVNLGWPDGRKIFMGDAGSTLLGFLLAWSLVYLSHSGVARIAPVDVLWCVAIPVMDTLAVMVRRARQGRSMFKPDRQHLHHLLLDAGLSPRVALGLIVAGGALLATVGFALRGLPELLSLAAFAGTLVFYVFRFPQMVEKTVRLAAQPRDARGLAVASAGATVAGALPPASERAGSLAEHRPIRALCVLGEPNDAIKVAPVARQLYRDARFETRICLADRASEEQRRMLELLELRPDVDIALAPPHAEAAEIASTALSGMKRLLGELKPDVVLVHGDTPATLAATLAASYDHIPVARLESPAQEAGIEGALQGRINRRLASALASLHFTPTESAVGELLANGVPADRIQVTGDTAVESLRMALERIRGDEVLGLQLARRFSFLRPGAPLLLVTHREQIAGFAQLGRALRKVARLRPDVDIVYPIRMTPEAHRDTQLLGWRPANVHLVEPLGYLEFAWLLQRAYLVLTGSTEVESEAALLGKPVLVLQENAAGRGETFDETHHVVHVDDAAITAGVMTLLTDRNAYEAMRLASSGDEGRRACYRIVEALASVPARSDAMAA